MVRTEWTEWPGHVQDHGAQQLPEISADAPRGIRRTRVEDQRRNSVAERSQALASGARPQGRGFEPYSCQLPMASYAQFFPQLVGRMVPLVCGVTARVFRHLPV